MIYLIAGSIWAAPIRGSQLHGEAGDDVLRGGSGSDVLDGGAGNDVLISATNLNGSFDTFVFGRGYGHDQVVSTDSRNGIFLKDLSLVDIELLLVDMYSIDRYAIRIKDSGETLRGLDYSNIGWLRMGDGAIIDWQDFWAQSQIVQEGSESDDYLEHDGTHMAHLKGGAGNDSLAGGGLDDILDGGAGNDLLTGGGGDDLFIYGLGYGHDVIDAYDSNQAKHDRLKLSNLNLADISFSTNYVSSDAYDLIITINSTGETLTIKNGILRDPQLFNPSGIGSIEFADGSSLGMDEIRDPAWFREGNDEPVYLQAGDEGEVLSGGSGDDFLYGGAGNDTLMGRAGADQMDGGAGGDSLSGGGDNDIIVGGAGSDLLEGGDGDDILFGDGADIDYFYENGRPAMSSQSYDPWSEGPPPGDDILYGGAGNDVLVGGAGSDILYGGDGDDILVGDNAYVGYSWEGFLEAQPDEFGIGGHDLLDGGAGNDIIYLGGQGIKTVVFGRGYGHDLVHAYQYWSGQLNAYAPFPEIDWIRQPNVHIRLLGVELDDLSFTRGNKTQRGYEVIITIKATGETLTLEDAFLMGAGDISEMAPEGNICRIAGLELDGGYVHWQDIVDQHPEFRVFTGTDGDDELYIMDSGAEIYGQAGNDVICAGQGHNILDGGAGDDQLFGGWQSDDLYGGSGDDLLNGGEGNDYLNGGEGDDCFIAGQGHDTIDAYDPNQGKHDRVKLDWWISPEEIIYTVEPNDETGLYDLILLHPESGETLRLMSAVSQDPETFNPHSIQSIEFGNGEIRTWSEIYDPTWSDPLPGGGRRIIGRTAGGELRGTGLDDILHGLSGDDHLYGEAGNDTLFGGEGNDHLYGGEGDDFLSAGAGINILDGGAGNDTLALMSDSSNTVIFARGSGHDTIIDEDYASLHQAVFSLVSLNQDEVSLDFVNNEDGYGNLIITIKNTGETLTLLRSLQGYGDRPQDFSVNYFGGIQFRDGFLDWNSLCLGNGWRSSQTGTDGDDFLFADYISGGAVIDGLSGNDQIYGGSGLDLLRGGDGDDHIYSGGGEARLYGDEGNDCLYGSVGNDYLEGGTGDDSYFIGLWDGGNDVINNQGGGQDMLQIDYASPADLWFGRDGSHLVIGLIGGGQITVNNWYEDDDYRIETIQTDSYAITENQVALMVQAMAGIGVPAGVNGGWTEEQKESLVPVLSTYWQPKV